MRAMHPPCPATAAERVDYVASLMRSLTFKRGDTVRELAAAWGMARSTVENYSAEASRRVRAEVTDPDYVTGKVCVAIERVIDSALADDEARDGHIEARRVIVQASKTWAEIVGGTRVRVEVAPSEMTAEELRAQTVEALRTLANEDPQLFDAAASETPVR